MKVFLGGTVSDTDWRGHLIQLLSDKVDYFDPVVDDWTDDAQEEELRQRKLCDYVLYVITPDLQGVYSIAEVVDDSHRQPSKTIFCVHDEEGFTEGGLKSLNAVKDMLVKNGATVCDSLLDVAQFLNIKAILDSHKNK